MLVFFNLFLFNLLTYLIIYFWLHWVFVAVRGLSLFAASRGYSFFSFFFLNFIVYFFGCIGSSSLHVGFL